MTQLFEKQTISVNEVIEKLNLRPLTVEGGFFYETYRSTTRLPDGKHSCGTCIYYLMQSNNYSNWHKVSGDEIWLYHAGTPAIQLLLFPDGSWTERIIGPDISAGHVPQSLIPAETWQAAVLLSRDRQTGVCSAPRSFHRLNMPTSPPATARNWQNCIRKPPGG